METYFISDLHFGHSNVLSFDSRPFKTIAECDAIIIQNWNNTVGIDDDVYILGDISWYNVTETIGIIKKLNGNKHLIIGNHDGKLLKNALFRNLFCEITAYKELKLGDDSGIVLCHYPIPCFNKHFYGWYHLYGHVHNGFEWNMTERSKYEMKALYDKPCNMYNVGCMISYMNYTPRTLKEIIEANES